MCVMCDVHMTCMHVCVHVTQCACGACACEHVYARAGVAIFPCNPTIVNLHNYFPQHSLQL